MALRTEPTQLAGQLPSLGPPGADPDLVGGVLTGPWQPRARDLGDQAGIAEPATKLGRGVLGDDDAAFWPVKPFLTGAAVRDHDQYAAWLERLADACQREAKHAARE